MVTTNRNPDPELTQQVSNWRVISTDGAPLSVLPTPHDTTPDKELMPELSIEIGG